MPPFKVKASCLECKWNRTSFYLRAFERGDKHAEEFSHEVQFWKLSQPPEYMGTTKGTTIMEGC